jgi:hypothetical protein
VSATSTSPYLRELEQFLTIFQEAPQQMNFFLQPCLSILTKSILDFHQNSTSTKEFSHNNIIRAMYLFSKTAGWKSIGQYLPHQVTDFHTILAIIDDCNSSLVITPWETWYILLLWLSVLVLLPFKLDSLVSRSPDVATYLTNTILVPHLSDSGATREIAAICLARLLFRPDLSNSLLFNEIFQSFHQEFTSQSSSLTMTLSNNNNKITHKHLGSLKTLVEFFKRCSTSNNTNNNIQLLHLSYQTLQVILPTLTNTSTTTTSTTTTSSLERKFASKLAQRAGCYLVQNQHLNPTFDYSNIIQLIVTTLLDGLRDKDTITRWSSAKGIARILILLNDEEKANQMMNFILDFFDPDETDGGWHGACLCLAEICRKKESSKFILSHLERIVKHALIPSLEFDRLKGMSSIGTHVRDAACFLAWSMSRASWSRNHLPEFAPWIAIKITMVTLFDREINCRRAASAALQELVGRLGREVFPFGIELITQADFVAVGNLSRSFVQVAPIAVTIKNQQQDYFIEAIHTLVELKLTHWDIEIRNLSAISLEKIFIQACLQANVCEKKEEFFITIRETWFKVIDVLVPRIISTNHNHNNNPNTKHGALLGLSACCTIISHVDDKCGRIIMGSVLYEIGQFFLSMSQQQQQKLNDYGNRDIRIALCSLISNASELLPDSIMLQLLEGIIEPCLKYIEPTFNHASHQTILLVREAACLSLFYVLMNLTDYCKLSYGEGFAMRWFGSNNNNFSLLETWQISALRGLTSIFEMLLPETRVRIHRKLCETIHMSTSSNSSRKPTNTITHDHHQKNDVVASRRDAIVTLGETWGFVNVEDTLETTIFGMRDYHTDERGDVGSHVRIASLKTCERILKIIAGGHNITTFLYHALLQECAKLACEKLDSVRIVAYQVLLSVFSDVQKITNIELCVENDAHTFTHWCEVLLANPLTRKGALEGLILTCGALTESSSKRAETCLLSWCEQVEFVDRLQFGDLMLNMLRHGTGLSYLFSGKTINNVNDRVIIPTLKTLGILLAEGIFDPFVDDDKYNSDILWITAIRERIKMIIVTTKNPSKLIAASKVLIGLGGYLRDLLSLQYAIDLLLQHEFPKVRMACAEQFVLWGASRSTSTTNNNEVTDKREENINIMLDKISETKWDELNMNDVKMIVHDEIKIYLL